jgi:hypothetical protein
MLGSGAAFLRENLDTAIRSREDLERILGLSSLGVVPRLDGLAGPGRMSLAPWKRGNRSRGGTGNGSGNGRVAGRELVALHDNRSSGAEAYRSLRTNLLFSGIGEETVPRYGGYDYYEYNGETAEKV